MIWLIIALALYPVSLFGFAKYIAKLEREACEWEAKGYPRNNHPGKKKDWPLGLFMFGIPFILFSAVPFAWRPPSEREEAVIGLAASVFLAAHLFLCQEVASGQEAIEKIEAEKCNAKDK